MTELDTEFRAGAYDLPPNSALDGYDATIFPDVSLPDGAEAIDASDDALVDDDVSAAEFGTLAADEEQDEVRYDDVPAIGANVMARTAEVVTGDAGYVPRRTVDKSGVTEEIPRSGDRAEDGDPPRGGDGGAEHSDEEDRRAELARRYAEKFASKVEALRGEVTEEIFANLDVHPGFVGYDLTDPWIGNFQIASVDSPERAYGVRVPLENARTRVNEAIEERRLDAFLQSDELAQETKDSMVQIVAFDPDTHTSITEAPGIPMHVVPRSMWTAISRPETLEQLRNATLDLAKNGITVLENYPIVFWDHERERIVLGNCVPEVEPEDGEEVPSDLERGLARFRKEAQSISQMCPRPETARMIRARAKELFDELTDEPMYLEPLQSNMPELEVVTGGRDGARVPLPNEVQDEIVERTNQAEEVPGFPAIRNNEQLLLDGLAHGLSQQRIADAAGLTRDDMVDVAREVKDWLGMPDQPSSLYKALLHHSIAISPPEVHVNRPILTTNEAVHFYLASIGFSKAEASRMVGVAEGTVKRHRDTVLKKLQATSMPQAIAHAFACRYYKSFPPAGDAA